MKLMHKHGLIHTGLRNTLPFRLLAINIIAGAASSSADCMLSVSATAPCTTLCLTGVV